MKKTVGQAMRKPDKKKRKPKKTIGQAMRKFDKNKK